MDGKPVQLWVENGWVGVGRASKANRFSCPECESELAVCNHFETRPWRHLDSYAFLTYLHATPPRHGHATARLRTAA